VASGNEWVVSCFTMGPIDRSRLTVRGSLGRGRDEGVRRKSERVDWKGGAI
jgi:hypothetical protein